MAFPDLDAEALRMVLGALPDIVMVVGPDRRVVFVSRPDGMHRPEDLEGRDAVELLDPDSRRAGEAALEQERALLEQLVPLCAWCRKIRTGDGDWLPLEAYLTKTGQRPITDGMCPDCEHDMTEGTANSA